MRTFSRKLFLSAIIVNMAAVAAFAAGIFIILEWKSANPSKVVLTVHNHADPVPANDNKCYRFLPDHPVLLGELAPNCSILFKGGYFSELLHPFHVFTNSHGLRDYEYPLAKPADVYRIAVIGDSFAFGYGVEIEDTFVKQLERIINSRSGGRKFEVLNFGVDGYCTAEEVEMLKRKGLAYGPDMVIVAFISNDFIDSKLLWKMTEEMKKKMPIVIRPGEARELDRKLQLEIERDRYEEMWASVVRSFDELDGLAVQGKFRVVIVPLALDDATLKKLSIIAASHRDWMLVKMAKSHPPYSSQYYLTPDNIHPNPAGHRMIAEEIFEDLKPLLEENGRK